MDYTRDELVMFEVAVNNLANLEDRQARSRALSGPEGSEARRWHRAQRDRLLRLAVKVANQRRAEEE